MQTLRRYRATASQNDWRVECSWAVRWKQDAAFLESNGIFCVVSLGTGKISPDVRTVCYWSLSASANKELT